MLLHHTAETCVLCGQRDLELVMGLKPSALAEAYAPADQLAASDAVYPLDLYLCRECGHVQLLDIIAPEALFRHYSYVSASSPGLAAHFRSYADRVVEVVRPSPGARALDIGSNDGTLLQFFRDQGFEVLGVDPAERIAADATSRGIPTIPAFFSSNVAATIRQSFFPIEIITANNVFAHSRQLPDMADGIRQLLAPSGAFVFEVSYLPDMIRNRVFDFIYHEHISYHTVRALDRFLRSHGMELFHAERVPIKGGSLRAYAQLLGGPRPVSSAVPELARDEEAMGVDQPQCFVRFAAEIETQKEALHRLLRPWRDAGGPIAGYGASATVTTLLYHFELGDIVQTLVDDNPSRHGLYSPGFRIPVVSPEEWERSQPPCTILVAWRFAHSILQKRVEYQKRGGTFLVPLPQARQV